MAVQRRVRMGLALFFGGAAGLLLALLAQWPPLAGQMPDLALELAPEGPAGYTAATLAVAWGVWAMGSALRPARGR